MWFVYSNEVVSGPFDTATVQQQLKLGRWTESCFVWWKGQREWMPIRVWENQLKQIIRNEDERAQSPVWYIDVTGSAIGPLTQAEMFAHLRGVNNLSKVRLWTVGMSKWTPIFELHDIVEQLGMSRRVNERAPLMGTVAVSRMGEETSPMIAKAASVSVAGMGINEAHGLQKGDEIQLVVKSPDFPNPLRFQATVVFVTSQGYAGMKFTSVHPETQSLLFDYVKKFNLPTANRKSA